MTELWQAVLTSPAALKEKGEGVWDEDSEVPGHKQQLLSSTFSFC